MGPSEHVLLKCFVFLRQNYGRINLVIFINQIGVYYTEVSTIILVLIWAIWYQISSLLRLIY